MAHDKPASRQPDAPTTSLRLPSTTAVILLFSWWLGVGWHYYQQPALKLRWDLVPLLIPNPFAMKAGALWDLIKLLVQLGWFLVIGTGLGEIILARLSVPSRGRLLRLVVDVAVGWGVLGLAMAALGLLKLWYPSFIFGVLAAMTLPAVMALRRAPAASDPCGGPWAFLDIAMLLVLAAFLGLNLLGAMMPEIFYDALSCHLVLPNLFWRHHGFFPVFENAFSGVPLLVQSLFALALPVGGERLAHLLHLAFGVLCALSAFDFGRRFGGRRTGLLAALLFYANPLVGVISWKATVDLGTVFYQFMALYAAALAFQEIELSARALALAGVFTGLAMGTKYQAWPLAIILTAVVAWRLRAFDREKALRALAAFTVAMTAAAAIWPLRNWILYGNPLFPFYQERFASIGALVDWRAMLQDGGRNWKEILSSWTGLRQLLKSPWELSTQQLDTRSFGPVFLLGLPLLIAVRFRSRAENVVLSCTLALCAAWSLTSSVPRYFLPAFLPSAILFALALERGLPGNAKKAGYILVLYVALVNLLWTSAWLKTYEADGVIFGTEKAEEYLTRSHPSYGYPYYACAVFINAKLPMEARVMTLGEERGHYIERDVIATTVFAEHPLTRALSVAANAVELRASLARDGVTHFLVNDAKILERGTASWLKLDARRSAVFDAFSARYVRRLFVHPPAPKTPECTVFAIAP